MHRSFMKLLYEKGGISTAECRAWRKKQFSIR